MQAPETIIHALWECGAAQDVWADCSQRALQKGLTAQSSVLQLVEGLMHKLPKDDFEAFLVQCWLLWHRRNRVVHGGLLQEPGVLIDRAKSLLAKYKDAQGLLSLPAPAGPCLGWQPPDSSTYKLNFDAAVFSNASASGVGVLIRNAGGQVMAALSSRGLAVLDSDEAEVLACRRALEFAAEAGFSDLIVGGDNANVMRSIVSTQADWSRLGTIFDDVRCLAGRLRQVEFRTIRRTANGAAHSLARFARNIREEIVWLEEDPPPALEALHVDSSYLSLE